MGQLFDPSKPYLAAWTWIHDVDSYRIRETIHDVEDRPKRPKATALYFAMLCGFSGLANYLILTHREDVNANCGKLGTPLHAASHKVRLDAVRILLTHGTEVNTTDDYVMTHL